MGPRVKVPAAEGGIFLHPPPGRPTIHPPPLRQSAVQSAQFLIHAFHNRLEEEVSEVVLFVHLSPISHLLADRYEPNYPKEWVSFLRFLG